MAVMEVHGLVVVRSSCYLVRAGPGIELRDVRKR